MTGFPSEWKAMWSCKGFKRDKDRKHSDCFSMAFPFPFLQFNFAFGCLRNRIGVGWQENTSHFVTPHTSRSPLKLY